jgi:hypothetical protein
MITRFRYNQMTLPSEQFAHIALVSKQKAQCLQQKGMRAAA